MWEDVKRVAALVLSHLREQKDLFLYKLIVANYSGTRESAFKRLGELYFNAYREGRITDVYDESIASEIEGLFRIEDEINRAAREIDAMRAGSAEERRSILGRFADVGRNRPRPFHPKNADAPHGHEGGGK